MADTRASMEDRDVAQLFAWQKRAEAEIAELEGRIAPLQQQLDAARERLDLLRRLTHLQPATSPLPADPSRPAGDVVEKQISPSSPGARSADLEANVRAVLQESGEPMHIGAIREALIRRGVPLPGRGDEANIIVRLRRAPDAFVRTGRGTYALSEWGLPEMRPVTRKKRVARRPRRASGK